MIPPIQLQRLPQRRRKKPTVKWVLFFLALLLLCLLALAGCSAEAAEGQPVTLQDIKRSAASAWLCPGMVAVWLDEQTVQCLRDRP